jgi:hypothetical protein
MLLMMDSSGERLYATGQGHGFSKAVEMQRAQPTEIGTRIGRLPDSPPPVKPSDKGWTLLDAVRIKRAISLNLKRHGTLCAGGP